MVNLPYQTKENENRTNKYSLATTYLGTSFPGRLADKAGYLVMFCSADNSSAEAHQAVP